jgi:hypothetical protein
VKRWKKRERDEEEVEDPAVARTVAAMIDAMHECKGKR